MTITIIAEDLHGALERLPILGGYLATYARPGEGRGVVSCSMGRMFQGSSVEPLRGAESCSRQPLGYTAAAVGNTSSTSARSVRR